MGFLTFSDALLSVVFVIQVICMAKDPPPPESLTGARRDYDQRGCCGPLDSYRGWWWRRFTQALTGLLKHCTYHLLNLTTAWFTGMLIAGLGAVEMGYFEPLSATEDEEEVFFWSYLLWYGALVGCLTHLFLFEFAWSLIIWCLVFFVAYESVDVTEESYVLLSAGSAALITLLLVLLLVCTLHKEIVQSILHIHRRFAIAAVATILGFCTVRAWTQLDGWIHYVQPDPIHYLPAGVASVFVFVVWTVAWPFVKQWSVNRRVVMDMQAHM